MIVPFDPSHLDEIELSDPAHLPLARCAGPAMAYLAAQGVARTILSEDGKVLAVAGVGTMVKNEVFIFPSKRLPGYAKTFLKDLRVLVRAARAKCGRLTSISHDTPTARRFFNRLGFAMSPPPDRPECVGMLGWVLVAVLTLGIDHFLRWLFPPVPGMCLAEPVTLTAVAMTVAAATAVSTGVMSYMAQSDAADAAKKLENQQADELKQEQAARAAEAATEAGSGQTFGFGNIPAHSILSGLGYGGGGGGKTQGAGRGSVTGMGGEI